MAQPDPEEIEVAVFGPGFGECSCVHLGDGKWMILDSCLDPGTGRPWALGYLSDLGVDVSTSVALVVVTHFDDDHIRGITEVASAAAAAHLVCPAAVNRRDFVQFVMEQEPSAGGLGSGVDEL